MRVVIVSDAWYPQVNGVVTTLSQLKQNLEKKGYIVDLIEPSLFKTTSTTIYPEISLSMNPWKIKEYLDTEFDYLHIATEGPLGFFARRFANKHDLNYTTAIHTKFPEYLNKMIFLPAALTYKYLRWFHNNSNAVLVNTNSQIKELKSKKFKNLKLWSRAIDKLTFYPREKKCADNYLLYVGRVSREKNLEAFLNLPTHEIKVVVGSGPMLDEYKTKYKDIKFVGPKFGNDLAQFYSDASVFVFPSMTDTYGIVMIEAMACGTPVAAFPVTGPIDVIEPNLNGSVNEDLERAVSQAKVISSQSCIDSVKNLSWDSVTQTFLDTLVHCKSNQEKIVQA